LAVGIPTLFHHPGLEPHPGSGGWRCAGSGKRTVTQVLRVMGLADEPSFRRYHEVLSRARWDGQAVARRLLLYIIARLLPDGVVVVGIDDTIERRWGARINARGIYRDPVRSSKGHFVKTSGLRWLSLMVAVPIPWAKRTWALPFLTILAPSARWSEANGKRHKTLTTWARQAILQTKRWLPNRRLVFVADSGFAVLDLLDAVRSRVCMITRLRLDANLFRPAPKRRPGQRGRTPLKGRALPKLSAVLKNKKTVWTSVVVSQWYNAQQRGSVANFGAASAWCMVNVNGFRVTSWCRLSSRAAILSGVLSCGVFAGTWRIRSATVSSRK
jgi:hypothetical protein